MVSANIQLCVGKRGDDAHNWQLHSPCTSSVQIPCSTNARVCDTYTQDGQLHNSHKLEMQRSFPTQRRTPSRHEEDTRRILFNSCTSQNVAVNMASNS